jgi:phytoene dehydrogenase-like protein
LNRVNSKGIQEVENLIPGLEKSILVMDMATPLTFEEQGGRSGGAVAGWSWNYEDHPDYHPRELVRTPIQGLYMAGYQASQQSSWVEFPLPWKAESEQPKQYYRGPDLSKKS